MTSQRERQIVPLWKRKPHFRMPSIEAPFVAGGSGWNCSVCGQPVEMAGPFTISCPEHPRAAVRP